MTAGAITVCSQESQLRSRFNRQCNPYIILNTWRLACRLWYIYAVALTYRLRYYFAWAVSESALIFSGLCFNGYDEKTGKVRSTLLPDFPAHAYPGLTRQSECQYTNERVMVQICA